MKYKTNMYIFWYSVGKDIATIQLLPRQLGSPQLTLLSFLSILFFNIVPQLYDNYKVSKLINLPQTGNCFVVKIVPGQFMTL